MNIDNIKKLIRQAVNEVDPNAVVILYGSRARGKANLHSDWDILILTEYPVNLKVDRKFRNRLYDLELYLGEAFSIFVYSRNEWRTKHRISPFYQNVVKEGINL